MPLAFKTVNHGTLLGKEIAEKIRERMGREAPRNIPPPGSNTTHTDAGDPLRSSFGPFIVYPSMGMITGSGGGPIIGREPRDPLT